MNNNMENKSATEVADKFERIPEKCDFCSPIAYTAIGMFFILKCLQSQSFNIFNLFKNNVISVLINPKNYCK